MESILWMTDYWYLFIIYNCMPKLSKGIINKTSAAVFQPVLQHNEIEFQRNIVLTTTQG